MFRRIGGIYLWIALFLTIPVGQLRNLAGTEALIGGYAIFVALTVAAIWKIGAQKTESGFVREHPAFLPGVLLLAGPLVLILGASVTGHPTGERPGYFMFNTTALLLGVMVLLIGFALLSARLWEAGERLLSVLGIAGFLLGAVLFAANMLFRYAVIASGAAEAFVVADRQVFPALGTMPFPLEAGPSWLAFLYVWATLMLAAYGLISYLTVAAYGASLVKAGWIGKTGGRIFVTLSLALALVMGPGWLFLENPVAEFLLFFLGVPFMTVVLPYFVGVALLAREGHRELSRRKRSVRTEVTAQG